MSWTNCYLYTVNGIIIVYALSLFVIGAELFKIPLECIGSLYILYSILLIARSIIGIIGIKLQKERLILAYIILIPLLWVIFIITGSVGSKEISHSEKKFTDFLMEQKLRDVKAFHDFEREYECCGLKGAVDYGDEIERACCETTLDTTVKNKTECYEIAIKRPSCPKQFVDAMLVFFITIAVLGLIFILLEIACLVFAIKRYKQLRKVEISD